MKKTRVIDRYTTVKDVQCDKGVVTEFMVEKGTCPTVKMLGVYMTVPVGGRSELRCHENAELAWYLLKGKVIEVIIKSSGERIEGECGPGAAGYIAPGDYHQEINIGGEAAEFVMGYAKANSYEQVGTKYYK